MTGQKDRLVNAVPDLSVVILCYQAGPAVRDFVNNAEAVFASSGISDYELVLVGNYQKGSVDDTPHIVRALAKSNPRIRFRAELKLGMMGWDMRAGLAQATGRYIAVIDGDGQMPVEDVVRVYSKIRSGGYDLVTTYRVVRGDSVWRKYISWNYNLIIRFLFPGLGSTDANSKPKILRRDKYEMLDLRQDDWFVDAEIMIQARRLGFKTHEIPTVFRGLVGKRKSFVRIPAIWEFIKNLIVFRLREFFVVAPVKDPR